MSEFVYVGTCSECGVAVAGKVDRAGAEKSTGQWLARFVSAGLIVERVAGPVVITSCPHTFQPGRRDRRQLALSLPIAPRP